MVEISSYLSNADKEKIKLNCYVNPCLFLRVFLSEMFSEPIPWFHRAIIAILTQKPDILVLTTDTLEGEAVRDVEAELDKIVRHFVWKTDPTKEDSEENPIFTVIRAEDGSVERVDMSISKYTMLMLPRGFSKTTVAAIGVPLWKTLYMEAKYILYVGETAGHAETQLRNVGDELDSNNKLIDVYGDISADRNSKFKWRDDWLQTTSGINLRARGRGGQIRGQNINGKRPDWIVGDDIEDEESVATKEQRDKVLTWFYKSMFPAIARKGNSSIVLLGTLLHKEALLNKLMLDKNFTSIKLGAIDKDNESIWSYNMSLADLQATKESYALNAKLDAYYMEYHSTLRDESVAVFKDNFIYRPYGLDETVGRAIVLDPAISDKSTADFASIAVVGMTDAGVMPVFECWAKRGATPKELIDKFFELSLQYKCTAHGVESNAYQASLIHTINEQMYERHQFFHCVGINNTTNKLARIKGALQGRYEAGYIHHTRKFPELELQLLEFPKGKKDCPDALSMAVNLLSPVAAWAAKRGDENLDLAADSLEDLEDVFNGDWRTY